MSVFRYRQTGVQLAHLQRLVPGALVLGSNAPAIYFDVDAPVASKPDLDDAMAAQGWTYDSTDPTTTPSEQSALNTLSRVNVLDESVLTGKRAGVNFLGAAVSVVDNPGADRADVTITAAALTGSTPVPVAVGDTGAVGVATDAARSDHRHAVAAGVPVEVSALANAEGVATTLARSDHQHRLALNVRLGGSPVGSRPRLNFVGASVVDNPGTDSVDVTISGGSFDQRNTIVWDHFLTGNVTTNALGAAGWRVNATGTAAAVTTAFESGRPGIVQLVGGTVATARAAIDLGETALGARFAIGTAGGPIVYEALVKLVGAASLLPANLQDVQIGFGLDWAADSELPDGVYARFTPGVDTFWSLVTALASVRTVQAGTVVPVANVWVRIGLVITPGVTPTTQLFINGVSQGAPVSTTMPTSVGVGFKIRAAGAVSPVLLADYVLVTQTTVKEGA